MATIRVYRTGSPSERMNADDGGYEALMHELFSDTAVWCIEGRASTGGQFILNRLDDGRIEEARWVEQPEHYVCEECGHKQATRFTTCPGCKTQDMIVRRAAGWQHSIVEA